MLVFIRVGTGIFNLSECSCLYFIQLKKRYTVYMYGVYLLSLFIYEKLIKYNLFHLNDVMSKNTAITKFTRKSYLTLLVTNWTKKIQWFKKISNGKNFI